MSDVVRIGMLGGGTVGQGVARIIRETADTIERATGHRLEIGPVLVRDASVERPGIDPANLTTDPQVVLGDPDLDIIIEVMETLILDYWMGERKGVQPPAVIRHLLLMLLYTMAAIFILGNVAGVNVMPLLATSTVVTVVLGLALQDTLGNLFAGLSMHVERPFSIGDWISVDGVEGQVVEMAWRATRIRTLTRDIVAIPNAVIGKARVQNFDLPARLTGRNLEVLVTLDASPEQVEWRRETGRRRV
jgi:small-conductance mechanosensitive channel